MNIDQMILARISGYNKGYKVRAAAHVNGQVGYIGIAQRGTAENAEGWLIAKILYDLNNEYSGEDVSMPNVKWSDYATTAYD